MITTTITTPIINLSINNGKEETARCLSQRQKAHQHGETGQEVVIVVCFCRRCWWQQKGSDHDHEEPVAHYQQAQTERNVRQVLAAEKGIEKIVVEVKSFLNESLITDFHNALGQYLNYKTGLKKIGEDD